MQKLLEELLASEKLWRQAEKYGYPSKGREQLWLTGLCNAFPQIVAYIRSLEKEHKAMKEVLETYSKYNDAVENGYRRRISCLAEDVLASLTIK